MFNAPIRFDLNEWVVLLSILVLLFVYSRLPKLYPTALLVIIWMMYSVLGIFIDQLIGTSKNLDMYDTMDTGQYDWFDIAIYNFAYPPYGYMFCHFFKMIRERTPALLFPFIVGWCVQTTFIEWLASLARVYHYKAWTPLFSFLFYLLLYSFIPFFLRKLESWWEQDPHRQKVS
ncbi:hypothetical protein [Brevibacillus migulae]|uniref:hypothetical protein n=1 Tax=Brevibacillus migulae TaxID=1644114 RepID=UPI00106EE623|nr:hypothetical protein [Brevibacillus migulae]